MKKYAAFAMALALAFGLFTGCGCTNSKPANTAPSTLPPTTGATIMPTTEATMAPTTMPTTAPATTATQPETETDSNTADGMTTDPMGTEAPTEAPADPAARNRVPMPGRK